MASARTRGVGRPTHASTGAVDRLASVDVARRAENIVGLWVIPFTAFVVVRPAVGGRDS
jgi:hypothetical protein